MLTTDDAPRPYPRLTEAQKDRIVADLLEEYRLDNLRPVREESNPSPYPVRRVPGGHTRGVGVDA